MNLDRILPRRLRARFTLIAIASAVVVFLLTAPLAIWRGRQLLFDRQMHDIEEHLETLVSKENVELHTIRQQAIAMTDVIEQWQPQGIEAWYKLMEATLSRLPKAHGVRLAFEKSSTLGPRDARTLYVRRGKGGDFERVDLTYNPDDPQAPGEQWYGTLRQHPQHYMEGLWSHPYTAPEFAPERVLTCSAPIISASETGYQFHGVAAIDVTVDTIFGTLQDLKFTDQFHLYLLDSSRRCTLALAGGDAKEKETIASITKNNPDLFCGFELLQKEGGDQDWFIHSNPITGEESCFFSENLPHNPSQLLYVIPKRELEREGLWLEIGICLLGLVTITGMGLLIRWSAGLVTRNLSLLRGGVKNVRAGNLRERIPPAVSQDETADVIQAFNGMVDELQEAFLRTEELARQQQRIATELDLARTIQESALPKPIQLPGGRIFSNTLPAQEIGGDFYDFFVLPGGRVTLAVGDVSGKGVSAAMFMVRASLLLRSAASVMELSDAIAQVNAMLVKSNPKMMFVTLFVAIWDPVAQTLTYVNAGHNPPVLRRSDGSATYLDRRSGPALGAMSGKAFPSTSVPFSSGDLLAVYTDGISEAPDASNAQFGVAQLEQRLTQHRDKPLDAIAEEVIASVVQWQGGKERFDDITLLLAEASQPAGRLELSGSLDTIETVVEAVEACARQGGMPDAGARELGLAACEVVTNIITYALRSDASRRYSLFLAWSGHVMTLRFEDNGPPFDPDSLPAADVRARLEDRPVGGLGWLLIRKATDTIRMDRVGETNILTLTRSRDHGGLVRS
jgi:sigma-B regulation protein RsbU (phosphoserine phosphatase)